MNWEEFISEHRDGLFIVYEPNQIWTGYLYYRETSTLEKVSRPGAPYDNVFCWGGYCGDDSECVDDEDMNDFKKSTFFEIHKDSELFGKLNNYLEANLYGG